MAELVGFAPVKDGGGTRATNPGSEVTREGAMRTGGGFTRFLEEFRDHRCIVNPALSDLVEDRTQSGAVLDCSIVSIVSDLVVRFPTFSAASWIFESPSEFLHHSPEFRLIGRLTEDIEGI